MDKINKGNTKLIPRTVDKIITLSDIINGFYTLLYLLLIGFVWFTFTVLLIQGSPGTIIWYCMGVTLVLLRLFSK